MPHDWSAACNGYENALAGPMQEDVCFHVNAELQAQGHRVIVGEWSLATGVHEGGQAWADMQLDAFEGTLGWFFWSYRKEGPHRGGDTWSLRGAIAAGITGLSTPASMRHWRGAIDAAPAAAAAPTTPASTPGSRLDRLAALPALTAGVDRQCALQLALKPVDETALAV